MKTVKGRQLLEQFSKLFIAHIYPIAGTITDCYNQFPKTDANILCTTTFAKYFAERNLIIPWGIFVLDSDQDGEPYATSAHNIEVIFVFKLDSKRSVRMSINIGTLDGLIEYKTQTDAGWQLIEDTYVSAIPAEVAAHSCQRTILSYCENKADGARLTWPSYTELPE